MADNIVLNSGTGGATLATDDVTDANGAHYQYVKLADGTANSSTVVATGTGASTNGLRVALSSGSAVAATQSGSWTVDLGATDNAVLDNIDTSTTDVPNVIGTDGTAGPTKAISIGGTQSDGTFQEIAVDATGNLQIDLVTADVTNAGTFAVQAAQSGTWTVDLGATDNAVLDAIAAGFKNETGGVTDGVLIQGDDGTDRKNINVDATTGDVQVDVTNTVTVTGTVTADAGSGIATSANQTTIIGHVDGIEALLTTMDTDTSTIAGAVTGTEMQVDVVAALPAGDNNIGNIDIASIVAGTNLIGDVGISGARTSGGTTPFRDIDADETPIEISDTAAQLYWVHCMNLTAAVLYLHFYNTADQGVTVGTTTPTLTFPIPTTGDTNGAGFALSIPNGVAFGTALSAAVTTTVGGSSGPAANGCILNLGYAN